jgi:hypothetical protein
MPRRSASCRRWYRVHSRGTRRRDREVSELVLDDMPMIIQRARGAEIALAIKEVVVGDWGPGSQPRDCVGSFNPRRRSAMQRAGPPYWPTYALQQGDKQLVGNAGYRRFLATPDDRHFEIDAAEDARFDGILRCVPTACCCRTCCSCVPAIVES